MRAAQSCAAFCDSKFGERAAPWHIGVYSDLPTVIFRRFFLLPLTRRYPLEAHNHIMMLHERRHSDEITRAYYRSLRDERSARNLAGDRATIDHTLVRR
ncbi:MAG TPA: hypothetical protein VF113_15410 [Stellaceae bacterium]